MTRQEASQALWDCLPWFPCWRRSCWQLTLQIPRVGFINEFRNYDRTIYFMKQWRTLTVITWDSSHPGPRPCCSGFEGLEGGLNSGFLGACTQNYDFVVVARIIAILKKRGKFAQRIYCIFLHLFWFSLANRKSCKVNWNELWIFSNWNCYKLFSM